LTGQNVALMLEIPISASKSDATHNAHLASFPYLFHVPEQLEMDI